MPPVLVKMFKSEDPDPEIQGKMEKLETERDGFEEKMFKKVILIILIKLFIYLFI